MKNGKTYLMFGLALLVITGAFAYSVDARSYLMINSDASLAADSDVSAVDSASAPSKSDRLVSSKTIVTEDGTVATVTDKGNVAKISPVADGTAQKTSSTQPLEAKSAESKTVRNNPSRKAIETRETRAKKFGVTEYKAAETQKIALSQYGVKGDINNDGKVDFGDINWFAMVYHNQWYFKQYQYDMFWRADINSDGVIDNADINLFIRLLSN